MLKRMRGFILLLVYLHTNHNLILDIMVLLIKVYYVTKKKKELKFIN